MPDTVKESEFKGHPMIEILTSIGKNGEEYWLKLGLKKAQAIDENIDRIRMFIDKHTKPKGE